MPQPDPLQIPLMPSTTRLLSAGFAATRRGPFLRVVSSVVVALQLFFGGAVSVLDAQTAHGDRTPVHIEDARQHDCPVPHDADACQLCQLLSSSRSVSTSTVMPALAVSTAAQAPDVASEIRRRVAPTAGHGSRAPPRR